MTIEIGSGGETRASGLWGNGRGGGGGRGRRRWIVLAALGFVLGVPLLAGAYGGQGAPGGQDSYVAPSLEQSAHSNPDGKLRVIVQSKDGAVAASAALANVGANARGLPVVDAATAAIPASQLDALAAQPGLLITPDAPVTLDRSSSTQLWPYETGTALLWNRVARTRGAAPAIAIVDSGIDANRADFGGRVTAQVDLATLGPNSPGDGNGHGTFVAGIAAGDAPGYAGAAPNAKIVSIDVMNDRGVARTSDVIRAAQWILAYRARYDIRVANFSLHSLTPSSFRYDPLDKAIEKLWFGGVTVVASSGNYGTPNAPSGVRYAPGNDPFAITVGAVDINNSLSPSAATVAPWSAYGYTYDGFAKPELAAPGRYLVGPVPPSSTLALERPGQLTAPGYMQLSGTSFSAPIVAGTAIDLLELHPDWTPDQVKGALMATARPTPLSPPLATGLGVPSATRAAALHEPPNPNLALERFLVTDPTGDPLPVFDGAAWTRAVQADPNWDAASWNDAWPHSKNAASWLAVSWSDTSFLAVSWSDVSWGDVSWEDVSSTDAALGDVNATGGYLLPEGQQAPAGLGEVSGGG